MNNGICLIIIKKWNLKNHVDYQIIIELFKYNSNIIKITKSVEFNDELDFIEDWNGC